MITVYQADWEKCGTNVILGDEESVRDAWQRGLFREVATVHTKELDTAYIQTNSISGCWSANPAYDPDAQERKVEMDVVDWAAERGCRSTSVGDVMLHAGEYYVVASFGFKKLEGLPDLGSSVEDHRAAALEAYEKADGGGLDQAGLLRSAQRHSLARAARRRWQGGLTRVQRQDPGGY